MTGQVFFTNANAATLLTVVGDKLIDHGASTILENPEQITKGGAEATLGVALKQERTIDFITDSALRLQDPENRRRHLESYKRPETPTLGDMQSPNF